MIQKIAKYTSLIIKPLEARLIKKYAEEESGIQPIFIVGAPRTGSTLLYQLITNTFDLLYPDNLVEHFRRNFYFGFWLSNHIFKQKPHNCFSSNYGKTKSCGLHAPNECGSFWYRWLPKNRHYCTRNDIATKHLLEIKSNIFSVINRYKKPLLFKNLNAGQRLELISAIAPLAKIIFVKREPIYTAQSIYKAKIDKGIKLDSWWSIKPKNYLELEKLPAVEQIIKQIFFLEKQIADDSRLFKKDNFLTVNYKDICAFSDTVFFNKIRDFIGANIPLRKNVEKPKITINEKFNLHNDIIDEMRKEISKYDWDQYEIG